LPVGRIVDGGFRIAEQDDDVRIGIADALVEQRLRLLVLAALVVEAAVGQRAEDASAPQAADQREHDACGEHPPPPPDHLRAPPCEHVQLP
jgi:hypothetical protein